MTTPITQQVTGTVSVSMPTETTGTFTVQGMSVQGTGTAMPIAISAGYPVPSCPIDYATRTLISAEHDSTRAEIAVARADVRLSGAETEQRLGNLTRTGTNAVLAQMEIVKLELKHAREDRQATTVQPSWTYDFRSSLIGCGLGVAVVLVALVLLLRWRPGGAR